MMPRLFFFWLCGFASCFSPQEISGQSVDVGSAKQTIINKYIHTAQNKVTLYTGKLQTPYPRSYINSPYMATDQYSLGEIGYDGIIYPHVHLRLDLFREEIVALSPDTLYSVVLDTDKIEYAVIHGRRLEYLKFDNTGKSPGNGFYSPLYQANTCAILKKESVSRKEKARDKAVVFEFEHRKDYYLVMDGLFHPVNNKRALLKALESHKKELNAHIKLYKMDFKHSFEESLITVIKKYEELSQKP